MVLVLQLFRDDSRLTIALMFDSNRSSGPISSTLGGTDHFLAEYCIVKC